MIRGEYEVQIGDAPAVVIPNQFTIVGAQMIFKAAFWGESVALKIGLCGHNPASMLSLGSIQEPDGTGNYARIEVPMGQADWPILGSVNGESFIESRSIEFPIDSALSVPVNRLFLTDGTYVFSISSQFPDGLQIYDSPIRTKYRLFMG